MEQLMYILTGAWPLSVAFPLPLVLLGAVV